MDFSQRSPKDSSGIFHTVTDTIVAKMALASVTSESAMHLSVCGNKTCYDLTRETGPVNVVGNLFCKSVRSRDSRISAWPVKGFNFTGGATLVKHLLALC